MDEGKECIETNSKIGLTTIKANGKSHCTFGPAVIGTNGFNTWYLHGKALTEQEFVQVTKPNGVNHDFN